MSRQVHYKGKLELVKNLNNKPLLERCEDLLIENDVDLDFTYMGEEDIFQEFYDCFYEEYIIVDNDIYKVLSMEEIDDYDMFNVHDNLDGTYDYEVSYYNGGCSFEDAINNSFENRKE